MFSNNLIMPSLVVTLLSFFVTSAYAQGRPKLADVNKRLIRVENILDQSLVDMVQTINGLKREIRELRGELESQAHSIGKLKQRNLELGAASKARITELERKLDSLQFSGADSEGLGTEISSDEGDSGEQTAVFIPSDETNNAKNDVREAPDGPVSQTRNASKDEKTAYAVAYDRVNQGFFGEAIVAFDDFLNNYPDGAFADNAWYWQGEALYAQRDFESAIVNFKVVADSFPGSPKAPDAELKTGYALYELGRMADARQQLSAVVANHAGRSAAILARKRLLEMEKAGL